MFFYSFLFRAQQNKIFSMDWPHPEMKNYFLFFCARTYNFSLHLRYYVMQHNYIEEWKNVLCKETPQKQLKALVQNYCNYLIFLTRYNSLHQALELLLPTFLPTSTWEDLLSSVYFHVITLFRNVRYLCSADFEVFFSIFWYISEPF